MRYLLALISISFLLALNACSKKENHNDPTKQIAQSEPDKVRLMKAIYFDDTATVKQILYSGFNPSETYHFEDKQFTPLLAAISLNRDEIALLLIEKGANIYSQYEGYSAIDYSHFTDENSKLSKELKLQVTRGNK